MRKYLLAIPLLLLPASAFAAMVFDNSNTGSISSALTGTVSLTVTSTAQRIVTISGDYNTTIASASFAGIPGTLVAGVAANGAESPAYHFCVSGVPAGANNAVVQLGSAGSGNIIVASYAGATCNTDYVATGTTAGSQTSLTVGVSTTVTGDWALWDTGTAGGLAAGAGTRAVVNTAGGQGLSDSGAIGSTGNYNMTQTANNNKWNWIVVAYKAFSSGGGTTARKKVITVE